MASQVQVSIDEPVFRRLQALARPFLDSPSTVIERLLDEHEGVVHKQRDASQADEPQANGHYTTSRGENLPLGSLRASYRPRGVASATTFEAKITKRGIEFDGDTFDSPSAAAIRAKKLAGTKGSGVNVNGWTFWDYYDRRTRRWIPLRTLRQRKRPSELSLDDLGL